MNRLLVFLSQVGGAAALWVADFYYDRDYLKNGFLTLLALAAIYLIFRIILEDSIVKKIKDARTKYSVRKAISIIYIVVFIAVVSQIWVKNTEALLVSYGIMGAGIAIALQDLFKNFVGGLILFLTGIYRIGDRVELNGRFGDVIDIGLMYTTLLEIQGWVEGDQATGRLTMVPNGTILGNAVNNYTKDHSFIWDEISLPITYDSDWRSLVDKFTRIAKQETAVIEAEAERQMAAIMEKYYFSKRAVEPIVYMTLTDNWIELSVRYITDVRQRRGVRSKLNELFLKEIEAMGDKARIASESINITEFPELRTVQKG